MPTSAPGLGSPARHLRRDWSCVGFRLFLFGYETFWAAQIVIVLYARPPRGWGCAGGRKGEY